MLLKVFSFFLFISKLFFSFQFSLSSLSVLKATNGDYFYDVAKTVNSLEFWGSMW